MTFSRLLKECSRQFSKKRTTSTSKRPLIALLIARQLADTAAINRTAVLEWSWSINAKGFAGITIGQADELTEIAKLYGAKGLAFIKIENGEWKSPIVKFFSEAEKALLKSKLNIEEGDCVFFGADKWEIACEVLGRLRLRIAEMQDLVGRARSPSAPEWDFLWVTDFPLFEWSAEENKWNAMHHPFTRPKAEDMPLFEAKKFPDVRAEAYDVVLNGVE